MFNLEEFSFYPAREQCRLAYEDESGKQQVMLKVAYTIEGLFPTPGSRIALQPKTFTYLKVHEYGVEPPHFTRQDLEPYLVIEEGGMLCWFYENDSFGGGIHHFVDETAATIEERQCRDNRHCYLLPVAAECGLLPPALRPNPQRILDRDEVIHRLRQAGLQCGSSPLSRTPIRVTCINGDARSKVRAVIPDPYLLDDRHEGNTTSVDLWEWGTEPLKPND